MISAEVTDELRNEEVRLIARSTHLPVDDRELAVLGDYIDAYDAGQVRDCFLYVQVRAKVRAYIAQRLAQHIRWNSGQDGAVSAITKKLRSEMLKATRDRPESLSGLAAED